MTDTTHEFYNLVQKLTREHDVTVSTDNGPRFVKIDGLLSMLRDEVLGSSESGSVAGNKMRLPFNAPAVDLYTLIDRQIAEVWAAAFNRVPNADRPEALLAEWAALVDPTQLVTFSISETVTYDDPTFGWKRDRVLWQPLEVQAEHLLARWVRAIEDLFNPPRTADIVAACIQCGAREVHRRQDGQTVRQAAMQFIRDRETGESLEARCQACGMAWDKGQFEYLSEKIDENEDLASVMTEMDADKWMAWSPRHRGLKAYEPVEADAIAALVAMMAEERADRRRHLHAQHAVNTG